MNQNFEKFTKKNKLSYAEYNDRHAGRKKRGKQKRGKTRYSEAVE